MTLSSLAQLSPGKLAQDHSHLEGLANCTQCHDLGNAVTNNKCLACHEDIQSLMDQKRGYHNSAEVREKTCVECHSEHHGRKFEMTRFDQDNFNHDLTGYILEGAHDRLEDCKECHQAEYIEDPEIKKRENTFLGLQEKCLSCHEDYHQETLDNDCISCHNFEEWRPAPGFDHDQSNFPLKGAHIDVDCIECHEQTTRNGQDFQVFTGMPFENCTDCHEDVHNGKFGQNCLDCHNENSFTDIVPNDNFNHDLTDYPLRGLHQGVECKECHTAESYTDPIAFQYCRTCHEDYHEGEFKKETSNPDCNECHSIYQDFTFTSYGLEEHNESSFPLEGAHIATPCLACHLDEKEEKWKFIGVGSACIDCHEDIHEEHIDSSYYPAQDCKACHIADNWTEINFDHERTEWPLEGKHEVISCRECHFDESVQPILQKFNSLDGDCVECHENVHGDQFLIEGITECTRCHATAENWNANNFDHDKTEFPLEGRHAEVECKACHKEKEYENQIKRVEYKIEKFECADCHS